MSDERHRERTDPAVAGTTAGRLLVATPTLLDPNFYRTVLLVLEHDEDGALAVVLNRPVDHPVTDVLPAWEPFLAAPGTVFIGGPVEPEMAVGIALRNGTEDPSWRPVLDGVGLIDLSQDPDADVERVRVFAGYAGWGPGQLEFEIAEGSWFVLDGHLGDVFTAEPDRLWDHVVGRQRSRVALYRHHPFDPRTN